MECVCLYACVYELCISQELFIQSTSYLVNVQLGTKGGAVSSVKLFGHETCIIKQVTIELLSSVAECSGGCLI